MIEFFTMGAPSPRKVSIMLEEVGLPYEWHWVNAYAGEHKQPAFLAKSPNGRLPAMIDHDAPDGPLLLWESAAMLIYLAEKTGLFLPASGAQRYHVLKWASFQATHAPYLGNAHWYRLLSPEAEPYSINRFIKEARRIYTLLDEELARMRTISFVDTLEIEHENIKFSGVERPCALVELCQRFVGTYIIKSRNRSFEHGARIGRGSVGCRHGRGCLQRNGRSTHKQQVSKYLHCHTPKLAVRLTQPSKRKGFLVQSWLALVPGKRRLRPAASRFFEGDQNDL